MKELLINNWEWILALIWMCISVASIIISFIQALKVERLKTRLEIEKNKAILNDSKIRKAYEDFVSCFIGFSVDEKLWDIDEWIKNFTKNSLLFSWENTIPAINKYKTSTNKNKNEKIYLAEDIFFAMRKDLWVSNKWMKHWDLIQFLVKWNISDILKDNK